MKKTIIILFVMITIPALGFYNYLYSQTCINDVNNWKLGFQKSSGDCIACHTVCTPGGDRKDHRRFCKTYEEWGVDNTTCNKCHDEAHNDNGPGDGHWNGDSSTCSSCHGDGGYYNDDDDDDDDDGHDGHGHDGHDDDDDDDDDDDHDDNRRKKDKD